MIQNVMIVESYRSPHEVIEDDQLCYEDKLRILEKWNQMLAIKSQVFPDQSVVFESARKQVVEMMNQLAKEHIHLHDPESLID